MHFSTEFSLKVMGDIQQFFIDNQVTNFYSVSVSGYHIAEAGANPITQVAFTLANGFTLAEYYLSRGMKIDDFARNFSFFFSNGMDPEYAVIGRVARRIWAVSMRNLYKADARSQKLKYNIQTSGRSLHAQEISFNDIRTTLQALYAIMDNCNSLHTNAYDEAVHALFKTLDDLNARLGQSRYLVEDNLTEADLRLWTTLVRFDPVYTTHFKCDHKRIVDYPHLQRLLKEIYEIPGVAETVKMDHIRYHYFGSHKTINPHGIISMGPKLDFN